MTTRGAFSVGTAEERGVVNMSAGKPVEIVIEYTNTRPPNAPAGSTERRTAQPGIMLGLVSASFSMTVIRN